MSEARGATRSLPGRTRTRTLVLALALATAVAVPARGQKAGSSTENPVAAALSRGDSLMETAQTEKAIEAYHAGLGVEPGDVTLLWKASLALSSLAEETKGREGDAARLREAIELARRAVRQDPRVSRAHTALSIALGRYGHHQAHVYRIQKAREVIDLAEKSHAAAMRARTLDPQDYAPYVVLGVMHRELATVHPVVKAVARTFLGGYPDVSLVESATLLERAVELAPDIVTARMQLARTYRAMERHDAMRRELELALSLEPRSRLERIELERAREFLTEAS